MDGENNGKPLLKMDDLGPIPIFGNTQEVLCGNGGARSGSGHLTLNELKKSRGQSCSASQVGVCWECLFLSTTCGLMPFFFGGGG